MTDEANNRAEDLRAAGVKLYDAGNQDAAVERYLKALAFREAPRTPTVLGGRPS